MAVHVLGPVLLPRKRLQSVEVADPGQRDPGHVLLEGKLDALERDDGSVAAVDSLVTACLKIAPGLAGQAG